MANEKDKSLINIKCDGCGANINIRYGTYRKTRNNSHYCRSCRGKNEHNRIQSLSKDEKEKYLKRKNQAISSGWKNQSPEQKDRISKLRKDEWNNEQRRKNHIEMLKTRWNNLSEDQRIEHLEKMAIGKNEFWSKDENKIFHSNKAREKWYNQTEEEQNRILQSLSDGRQKFIDNLTFKDRIDLARKRSEGLRKYWARLSPKEFEERMAIFKERMKEKFDKLDIIPNKNESTFIDHLDAYGIPYEFIWYNKLKHPDFDKMFSYNPIKPGSYISPYHAWDFRLFLNDGIVLVDVDGSIHNPECTKNQVTDYQGNKFILADYIQFKDSQRLYQTDGLQAYTINCHDDNLCDDTIVVDLQTNETMTFRTFISILNWMNMSDKEKKELIKLI